MKNSNVGVTTVHMYKKPPNLEITCHLFCTGRKKNAVINKEDDLLITAVVIHYITCVLKHITYPGVVSVKVLLIKILKCRARFQSGRADLQALSPQCVTNGTDVNMFICSSSLQFSAAHIVDEDYPGIMGLGKKKKRPTNCYLMCIYAWIIDVAIWN